MLLYCITDDDMFFIPIRETHKIEASGIRFDSLKIKSKQKLFQINIKYVDNDIKNKGVRNDNKLHYNISKPIMNCLDYRRPCLCGSFRHLRTNHKSCLLNPKYLD